jgi:hypothetical protein
VSKRTTCPDCGRYDTLCICYDVDDLDNDIWDGALDYPSLPAPEEEEE